MTSTTVESGSELRPFRVDIPDEAIADLRRRVAATRRPSKELVPDRSQGVQLTTIQELARYWMSDYHWHACEARLNALPQFTTDIDGVDIHFIHVKSPHPDALPLIMTHGWPGSVIELLEVIGPLTDPAAHGGSVGDAFDLVLPSVPGYGFSAEPTEAGWNVGCVAGVWAELMRRLDDRLRPAGFTGRPGGLAARPRHRRLLQDLPRLPRRAALRRPHPGPNPRQHHDVLADRHRGLGGPVVLGEHPSRPCGGREAPPGSQAPGRLHHLPRRDLADPRSWVEKTYPNVTYFNEVDKGGHFAAWEEPELFATEIRAAFKPLR